MISRTCRNYSTFLTNKLKSSTSSYLKNRSKDPIAWQEWNEETLSLAKTSDKPIFLSSGYNSSYSCYRMANECFSNQKIAEILNSNFIPVIIDKQQQPDIDAVYMMFLQMSTGHSSWPLNVFLTPQRLDPIFAGSLWSGPDEPDRQNRDVKFTDVLNGVTDVWKKDKNKVLKSAENMTKHASDLVKSKSSLDDSVPVTNVQINEVIFQLKSSFDSTFGGFSISPKFPSCHEISFLLNHGDKESKNMALFTLRQMAQGGIKDQIGHGFGTHSKSDDWNFPQFEKLLDIQSLVLNSYIDSYLSGLDVQESKKLALNMIDDISQYLIFQLKSPQGGFYSGQNSYSRDSDGKIVQGAYYTWKFDEFQKVIRPLGLLESDMMAMYWNVLEEGNMNLEFDPDHELIGQNVLYVKDDSATQVAQMFGVQPEKVKDLIIEARKLLLDYRSKQRTAPEVDTSIISAWNGMAIGALSRASSICSIDGALEAAINAAKYLKNNNYDESSGILYRIPAISGILDDYAFVISGLLDLYEVTSDTQYLSWAKQLQKKQIELFCDEINGAFYSTTEENAENLIFRPKTAFDTIEPSANSVSGKNLLKLYEITGNGDYLEKSKQIIRCYSKDIVEQPRGYTSMMDMVGTIEKMERK